jgi:RHS repeat-associated protein
MGKGLSRVLAQVLAILSIATTLPAVASQVTYYHTDALGSVVMESNEAGQVTYQREYRPYGESTLDPPKDGPAYTGHVQDTATGLTYMQQRYYDPDVGRFLSVDPVMVDKETGRNFNRYWYGNNNPYKFTDPDGKFGFPTNSSISQVASTARAQEATQAASDHASKKLAEKSSVTAEAGAATGVGIVAQKTMVGSSGDKVGIVPVGEGGYVAATGNLEVVEVDLGGDGPLAIDVALPEFDLRARGGAGVIGGVDVSLSGGTLSVTLKLGVGIGEFVSYSPIVSASLNED